jgi:iron-only hydrogenase group A
MQVMLNSKKVSFNEGVTVLELTIKEGIEIPTLCYHDKFRPEARCRLCVVEIDGKLVTSCDTQLKEGMNILTDSEKVKKSRRITRKLIEEKENRIKFTKSDEPIIRNEAKCILCKGCVNVCEKLQEVNAIAESRRGIKTRISCAFDYELSNSPCTFCGQCIFACNSDAITERDDTEELIKALKDEKKHVIVQTAPSIRASLGEMLDMPEGSLVTGKMVTALRMLGFDNVFDTDFAADMTTYEETNEFLERLKENKNLPLLTSCCPAWIRFAEYYYPEFLKNLSTCKSPQMMFGAVAKIYYAKKSGINPKNIVVVSVMPCTAKKFEISRPEMKKSEAVDISITTRELANMLKKKKIDLKELKETEFDNPLGSSSGSAAIYGVTGGVTESVLRSAKYILGEKIDEIEFKEVRGFEGIKEATVEVGGKKISIAVAHGLGNIRKVLEMIKSGKNYHIVEMMACPGGCIGGGGQPKSTDNDILKKRSSALYQQDRKLEIRIANKNPTLIEVYEKFIGRPLGKKAYKLLHTSYKKRELKIK